MLFTALSFFPFLPNSFSTAALTLAVQVTATQPVLTHRPLPAHLALYGHQHGHILGDAQTRIHWLACLLKIKSHPITCAMPPISYHHTMLQNPLAVHWCDSNVLCLTLHKYLWWVPGAAQSLCSQPSDTMKTGAVDTQVHASSHSGWA